MDEPGRVPSLASRVRHWGAMVVRFVGRCRRGTVPDPWVRVLPDSLEVGERVPELVQLPAGSRMYVLPIREAEALRAPARIKLIRADGRILYRDRSTPK